MTAVRRFSILLVAVGMASSVAAQHMRQSGMAAHYDPARETTIQGTVEEVETGRGMARAVFARIRVSTERIETVFLGPGWFLEEKKFTIAKGDEIALTGAMMEHRGVMLVRSIRKGEVTLAIRDIRGVPMWAGHWH